MRDLGATLRWTIVLVPMLAGGCASMSQSSDTALIREPGYRRYAPPAPVSESAKTLWEYAVLSENVYIGEWKKQRADAPRQEARPLRLPKATPQAYADNCVEERIGPLPLPAWNMWEGFPSRDLIQEALRSGCSWKCGRRSRLPRSSPSCSGGPRPRAGKTGSRT
jgi:hypothetical protein